MKLNTGEILKKILKKTFKNFIFKKLENGMDVHLPVGQP